MQFAAAEPLLNRTRLRLRFPCRRPYGSYPQTGFGEIGRQRHSAAPHFSQADFRVAILFSECIGDLSRAGVRVQRPGNRNMGLARIPIDI